MEVPKGSRSFEVGEDGVYKVSTAALPVVKLPEQTDFDALALIDHMQNVATIAVDIKMRLNLRGELVEGGSVLYGPGQPELGMGMTHVYLAGNDDPEDAMLWVVDKQSYDVQLNLLREYFPPASPDITWEGVIETLATEATTAGLSLSPPPPQV